MDLGLNGKTALVTGGGSPIGIGRAICITLAKEGCNVVTVDINLENVEETAKLIQEHGVEGIAFKADVRNRDEVDAAVEGTIKKFGQIDVLINNAGASSSQNCPFMEMTKEGNWDFDIGVNLYGQLNVAQSVLHHMIKNGSGKVVNISGGRGLPGLSLYGAAKSAVIEWTKALAFEIAPFGIHINSVVPGLARTGLTETQSEDFLQMLMNKTAQKALNTPQEVADFVVFLASERNSYLTGGVIELMSVL